MDMICRIASSPGVLWTSSRDHSNTFVNQLWRLQHKKQDSATRCTQNHGVAVIGYCFLSVYVHVFWVYLRSSVVYLIKWSNRCPGHVTLDTNYSIVVTNRLWNDLSSRAWSLIVYAFDERAASQWNIRGSITQVFHLVYPRILGPVSKPVYGKKIPHETLLSTFQPSRGAVWTNAPAKTWRGLAALTHAVTPSRRLLTSRGGRLKLVVIFGKIQWQLFSPTVHASFRLLGLVFPIQHVTGVCKIPAHKVGWFVPQHKHGTMYHSNL